MTCVKCGAALQIGAKFCAICGTPTVESTGAPSRGVESAPITVPAVTQKRPPGGSATAAMPQKSAPPPGGTGAKSPSSPPATASPPINVDPLGETAADAFAATDVKTTRDEIERALAERRAGKLPTYPPASPTNPGVGSPPPITTQEMQNVPPPVAASQVSPKAMSHVVPQQQARTAQIGTPPPMQSPIIAPAIHTPTAPPSPGGGARPQFVPLAPGSSGSAPAMSMPFSAQQPRSIPGAPYLVVGASVLVLWGNGQRYRGTVQNLQGTRALVVFPDGQQHWVETQYLTNV
jgi:hypothetical protein